MTDILATVHVILDEETWAEVEAVLRAEGWREEEGLRILVGYGAAVHLDEASEDPLRAWGAARAELATLRHRAYLADEAVRALRMNLTGLLTSVRQARQSLERLEQELRTLREHACKEGVLVPESLSPSLQSPDELRRKLRALFGRPEAP
ncbi:MAG: hypothetical protein QN172_04000 [Armatimonadota bacterium]|nr:hypothetical protein [Armatimonadota bacterium]MDR7563469.1 hypothetical protein [Armatimonadota bacterium]MDR7567741.1 hypothetical protein [Armatimonadota bacterium]MDR7601604.1 hypothetical protein [Armatimonadota bacterium]